jgi:hypothetical protein
MALSIKDIVTPEFIKNTVVLGVDLTIDDGSPFPDYLFESAIDQAIAMVESEIGIVIDPRIFTEERHDADIQERYAQYPIHLDNLPLRSVEELAIKIGTSDAATLPVQWITINNHQTAKFNIIPSASTVGSLYFRSGIPLLVGDVFSAYTRFSSYFAVTYTAGFTFEEGTFTFPAGVKDFTLSLQNEFNVGRPLATFSLPGIRIIATGKNLLKLHLNTPLSVDTTVTYSVNDVDPMLVRAISILASFLPLDVAGDLVAGAGIASKSIAIDSLSQFVGTTSSPENAGYSARVKQFQSELKGVLRALRAKYSRVNFWAR